MSVNSQLPSEDTATEMLFSLLMAKGHARASSMGVSAVRCEEVAWNLSSPLTAFETTHQFGQPRGRLKSSCLR